MTLYSEALRQINREADKRFRKRFASVVGLLAIPLGLLSVGYVAATMWGWFIVPLNPTLIPYLGFWQALGVMVATKLFTAMGGGGYKLQALFEQVEPDPLKRLGGELASLIVKPWVILGFAWLLKYAHENGVWAPF